MNSAKRTVLILMFGATFLTLLSQIVWKPYVEKKSTYISDSELQKVVTQMNENFPFMVDDITRIDDVEINERTLKYNYTMMTSGINVEDIPTSDELRKTLLNEYCYSKENNYFSTVNVTVNSEYSDELGKPIYSFTVKPEECKR